MSEPIAGYVKHPTGTWYFACSAAGLHQVSHKPIIDVAELEDHPLVRQHAKALSDMLDGITDQYSLPMVLNGTDFQKRVWRAIAGIGFGKTATYSQIAHGLGSHAVRAVGTACGANPVGIAIPCHRVIRSDGSLGGYGLGGLAIKQALLAFEKQSTAQAQAS